MSASVLITPKAVCLFLYFVLVIPVCMISGLATVPFLVAPALGGVLAMYRQRERLCWPCHYSLRWLLALSAAYLLISALWWAPETTKAVRLWWQLALLVWLGGVALLWVKDWETPSRHYAANAMLVGWVMAWLLLLMEAWWPGISPLSMFLEWVRGDGRHSLPHDFNRGMSIMAVMSWPLALALMQVGRQQCALLIPLMSWCAMLPMASLSATVALAIGMLCWAVMRLLGERGVYVLGVVLVTGWFISPVVTGLVVQQGVLEGIGLPASAEHRLGIWAYTWEHVVERPSWGWGLDASRSMPGGDGLIAPGLAQLPLHPHHMVLQLWLELGAAGWLVSGLWLALLWCLILQWPADMVVKRAMAASVVTYLLAGLPAYGVWQQWWWALGFLLAITVALFAPLRRHQQVAVD